MAGQAKFWAFALALGVGTSAFGTVTIVENFNDDPSARGWGGVGNTTSPNNYGFSNTDNTGDSVAPTGGTATGAGEIGGSVNRGPDSFYGVDLGGAVDFSTTDMSLKGVINNVSSGSSTTLNLGWSQGISTVVGNGDDPGAFLGITWDDGVTGALEARGNVFGIGEAAGPNRPINGTTVPFEMSWNSTTNTLTVNLNGDVGTLVLSEGDLGDLPDLTHWGMFGRTNHTPDNANVLWMDDLTFTAASAVVPEPASLGMLSVAGLAALRRRRQA